MSKHLGKGDVTLDRYGWKEAGNAFSRFYIYEVRRGRLPANTPVVIHKWWGAHVEYYFCRQQGIPIIGLGTVYQVGTYVWMNERFKNMIAQWPFVLFLPMNMWMQQASTANGTGIFPWHQPLMCLVTDKKAHRFFVYQLRGWKG
jgi:hypothetical protein